MSNFCFEGDSPHADTTYPPAEKGLSEMCDAGGGDDDELDFDLGGFDFWRATAGVTFRW